MKHKFQIGNYRPIYLWGGPGTIRMNKIKFMDYPVDEDAHREAHTSQAADRVVNTLYANWIHLMYDWGFPPEIEEEDWEDFRLAAEAYHEAGTPVFAYIQSSNCVFEGSFVEKDWYARNPKGRKIYYYSGRYMVDWTHPEWVAHLKDLIKGAIERGADGIFFDNMWYGEQPNALMGAWLGGAGCYCERCQTLYHQETGRRLPEKVLPDLADVADYLRWRARMVTATIKELSDYARELKPGCPISANDFDVTMRNSYLIYGLDVEALSDIQDVIMVENFALPRWDRQPKKNLSNNALTIRNTREFVRDRAHLSVLSYDVGIGFDPVYPPRRHQQGIGEAAACGASMTIKGTEYNDGERMTLLIDPAYQAQQEAIGHYNRWLEDHQELFLERNNLSPVGLLHPEEDLWRHWMSLAPIYYGASQALTVAGIPWRVVRKDDDVQALSVLLTFTPYDRDYQFPGAEYQHVHVPAIPGWAWRKVSAVASGGMWHDLVESLGLFLLRSYHGTKLAREIMDRLNMVKLVNKKTLFDLPSRDLTDALLEIMPANISPRVTAGDPVLIEYWDQDGKEQLHLMNYGMDKQEISVQFTHPVRAEVISPDFVQKQTLHGEVLTFDLDIYSILLID
ncbi:MAG: putative glycoside hydrolase [Brevefilum sp.]